jgi:hypothetical protein
VSLEIVYARRPKTFDKVDAKTLAVDQSTDIHRERAFVEIDLASGTLLVHAPVAMKEIVRASLGEAMTGARAFFRPARSYDLSPFADPDTALAPTGMPARLRRVELHALHVQTAGRTILSAVRPRASVLADDEATESIAAALRAGDPVGVKLYLFLDERPRPVCVEIATKGGKNVVDFDRSDPELVTIVREYLRACGVLRDLDAGDAPLAAV